MDKQKYWFFGSKLNTGLLLVLIILMIIALRWMSQNQATYFPVANQQQSQNTIPAQTNIKDTYTYTNHGFSIELPKGYIPKESESDTSPVDVIGITLPKGDLSYITDSSWWDKESIDYKYIKEQKIGTTIFKVYSNSVGYSTPQIFYTFKQGKLVYVYYGDPSQLETFKFVGWPQVEGDKDSLVSFSIAPGQEVSGKIHATGVLSGGYFFEGNLPVSILDANKTPTSYGPGHGQATTDWMTGGPVSFYIDFDFSSMPKGKAFIQLTQDDPSGGESGRPIKSVLIPIVIK